MNSQENAGSPLGLETVIVLFCFSWGGVLHLNYLFLLELKGVSHTETVMKRELLRLLVSGRQI